MKTAQALLLVLLNVLFLSCSGADNSKFVGVWEFASGNFGQGGLEGELKSLEFRDNETGTFYYQRKDTKTSTCTDFIYHSLKDGSLLLESGSLGTVDLLRVSRISLRKQSVSPRAALVRVGAGLSILNYQVADAQLTLTDGNLMTGSFTSAKAVAVEFQCKSFTNPTYYRDLAAVPDQNFDPSNLILIGSLLYFTDAQNKLIYPFDPAAGTLGTGIDFTAVGLARPKAGQADGNFWTVSGSTVALLSLEHLADPPIKTFTLNTAPVLLDSIFAAAWDGTYLWVNGYGESRYKFLKLDVSGVSPSVVTTPDFEQALDEVTSDGTSLWALSGNYVYKFDPTTLQALATYNVPDLTLAWQGIAAVGSDIYLLGTSTAPTKGVIAKVTP